MGWIMFLLGMMAGGMVGVTVMCVVFYARDCEMQANFRKNCRLNSP